VVATGGREVARTVGVDAMGRLFGGLGAVDVGPGGGVDDHVEPGDGGAHRRGVGDVELAAPEPGDPLAGEHVQQLTAEHAAGAGHEPARYAVDSGHCVTDPHVLNRGQLRAELVVAYEIRPPAK
jgi:hypothetical protein